MVVCFLEHNCCQLNSFVGGAMTLHFPHLPHICMYCIVCMYVCAEEEEELAREPREHHYHFWNATLPLSWLQAAMLMQLPSVTNTLTTRRK